MRIHKMRIIAVITAVCSAYLLFSCIITAVKIGNIDGIAKAKHTAKLKEARDAFVKDLSREHRAFTEEYGRKAKELEKEKNLFREIRSEFEAEAAAKKKKNKQSAPALKGPAAAAVK